MYRIEHRIHDTHQDFLFQISTSYQYIHQDKYLFLPAEKAYLDHRCKIYTKLESF